MIWRTRQRRNWGRGRNEEGFSQIPVQFFTKLYKVCVFVCVTVDSLKAFPTLFKAWEPKFFSYIICNTPPLLLLLFLTSLSPFPFLPQCILPTFPLLFHYSDKKKILLFWQSYQDSELKSNSALIALRHLSPSFVSPGLFWLLYFLLWDIPQPLVSSSSLLLPPLLSQWSPCDRTKAFLSCI